LVTISDHLKKIVVEQLGGDENEVAPSARFVNDLGTDSLNLVELIMFIEEGFSTPTQKVTIPDEDESKVATIQNATGYLKDLSISGAAPVNKSNDQSKNHPQVSKKALIR
jgi:acyl carrier protein